MLHLMPTKRGMPPLRTLLQDIGSPSPGQVAKALGVSTRTVWRWLERDHAPRPAMLALFWISRWGQSAVDAELACSVGIYRQLANALTQERDELRAQLRRLGQIGDYGSANDPSPEAPQGTPADRPVAPINQAPELLDQPAVEQATMRVSGQTTRSTVKQQGA